MRPRRASTFNDARHQVGERAAAESPSQTSVVKSPDYMIHQRIRVPRLVVGFGVERATVPLNVRAFVATLQVAMCIPAYLLYQADCSRLPRSTGAAQIHRILLPTHTFLPQHDDCL